MKVPLYLLSIAAAATVLVGCTSSKGGGGSAAQPSATPAAVEAAASGNVAASGGPSAAGNTAPTPAPAAGSTAPTPAPATGTASPTPAPSTSPAPSRAPSARTVPSPSAAPSAPSAGGAAATTADQAAIKAVVQKANDAQVQAFTRHDPTVMRDTATTEYYNQLVQIQRDLESSGVSAIKLVSLEWGPVTVKGTTAQATTVETWQTTYQNGSSDQDREQNVYSLVQQGGAWKIQSDVQPDAGLQQPAGRAGGGTGTTPAQPGGAAGSSGSSGSGGSASGSGAPNPTPAPQRSRSSGSSNLSSNWSGYAATGGTFTAVSGTWTVPQVTPTQAGAGDATWVGIGGTVQHDLVQAGTSASVTSSGRVRYNAWIETLPQASQPVPFTVSAGDTVTVTLTQQTSGSDWLITFDNRTTGQHYQVTTSYTSSLSSAEWVEEAPFAGRSQVPLSNFGTVQIKEAFTVKDGKRVNIAQAGGKAIHMISRSGERLATTSDLSSDGASFSVSREADSASAAPAGGGQPGAALPGRRRSGD